MNVRSNINQEILGFKIYNGNCSDLINQCYKSNTAKTITTLNIHSFIEQRKDNKFRNSLKKSDWILPDGVGIVVAAKILHKITILKISGFDIFLEAMKSANKGHKKVMFFGSTTSVLEMIEKKIQLDYPNVSFKTFSPDFKSEFNEKDFKHFSEEINNFSPDFLFLGLTAPKQEKLAQALKNKVNVKAIFCIGAVFDFYSNNIRRPSSFWIDNNLEWFGRLLANPSKLLPRLLSIPLFFFILFKKYFKMKLIKK